MFQLRINQVVGLYYQNIWKTPVEDWHFYSSQMFFKPFGSKKQLPGFHISRILVEYGLMIKEYQNLIELTYNLWTWFPPDI